MLAATAIGLHASLHDAAAAMSGTAAVFTPDPERIEVYDRLYAVYRDVYPALQGLFPRLAAAVT